MWGFIGRRVVGLFPTMLVIVVLSFFVVRLAPGSPFSGERVIPRELWVELDAKYGFDLPLHEQLARYVYGLLHGDLGLSTKYPQRSVNEIIALGFPATLQLAAVALSWALIVGIGAGVFGAVYHNTKWDHGLTSLAMLGISVPSFVLGPLLSLLFALTLYVVPPAGWGGVRHLILPGVTLGSYYAAYIARLTRAGMLEVVHADYIRTARAKGLPEPLVIWRHMLRTGLTPVVTFLGPAIADMLVLSVVVEKIFATPGIGPYFVDAAFNRDYFLVMGIVVVYSLILLIMSLIVDVLYRVLDPRVRYS